MRKFILLNSDLSGSPIGGAIEGNGAQRKTGAPCVAGGPSGTFKE
jgi:hypothetical protein